MKEELEGFKGLVLNIEDIDPDSLDSYSTCSKCGSVWYTFMWAPGHYETFNFKTGDEAEVVYSTFEKNDKLSTAQTAVCTCGAPLVQFINSIVLEGGIEEVEGTFVIGSNLVDLWERHDTSEAAANRTKDLRWRTMYKLIRKVKMNKFNLYKKYFIK